MSTVHASAVPYQMMSSVLGRAFEMLADSSEQQEKLTLGQKADILTHCAKYLRRFR